MQQAGDLGISVGDVGALLTLLPQGADDVAQGQQPTVDTDAWRDREREFTEYSLDPRQ